MSLGARSTFGSKAAPSATARILCTPREPLLFLYPRWIQTPAHSLHTSSPRSAAQHPSARAELASRIAGNKLRAFKRIEVLETAKEAYRDERNALTGIPEDLLPNWRDILEHLVNNTQDQPSQWHDNALRLLVPESSVRRLLFDVDDNIWRLRYRFSCHIKLFAEKIVQRKQVYRELLLSGTTANVARVTREIYRIVPEALVDEERPSASHKGYSISTRTEDKAFDGRPSEKEVSRLVLTEERAMMRAPKRPDQIDRPKIWTQANFYTYVLHLTSIKIHTGQHRIFSKAGEYHELLVRDLLLDIFCDELKNQISTAALNEALAYLMKYNKTGAARTIFVRMQKAKVPMDTETCNILLSSCAKNRDFKNFHFVLNVMRKIGLPPDSRTWIAFIRIHREHTIKQYAADLMRQKGLLTDLPIQQKVCRELVGGKLAAALESNKSLDDFLAEMDAQHGPKWMDATSANRIMNRLALEGLFDKCFDFLDIMQVRNVNPDLACLHGILSHCGRVADDGWSLLMRFYAKITAQGNLVPDEDTYKLLFNIANEWGYGNMMRVVWRYACLNTATTHSMRSVVKEVLWGHELKKKTRARGRGVMLGAKDLAFMSVLEDRYEHPVSMDLLGESQPVSERDGKAMERSGTEEASSTLWNRAATATSRFSSTLQSQSLAPGELRSQEVENGQDKLVRKITQAIQRDMEVYREWEPVRGFEEMLGEAVRVDSESKEMGRRGRGMVEWWEGRLVGVQVRRRGGGGEGMVWR